MSLAAETRKAVRARPFLYEGLRAGVINHSAAARMLGLSADSAAVAAALRRFAERLPAQETAAADVRVTMHSGLAPSDDDPLLSVGGWGFAARDGSHTGLLASGDVDAAALAHAIGVLRGNDVAVVAAGVAGDSLCVVVDRRDGAGALRVLEGALENVPR